MLYRNDKNGNPLSILGFGCMRFTTKGGSIDIDKAEREIMTAYRAGVNYYDTAYIYPGSEAAISEIFERNHIRDRIHIATKLSAPSPTGSPSGSPGNSCSAKPGDRRMQQGSGPVCLLQSSESNSRLLAEKLHAKHTMNRINSGRAGRAGRAGRTSEQTAVQFYSYVVCDTLSLR